MQPQKSSLFTSEDYLSIWIGLFFLVVGSILFFSTTPSFKFYQNAHQRYESILQNEMENAPFKTITWYQITDKQNELQAQKSPTGKLIAKLTGKPATWSSNPIKAFYLSEKQAQKIRAQNQEAYQQATQKEATAYANAAQQVDKARSLEFQDSTFNHNAALKIQEWRSAKTSLSNISKKYHVEPYNKIPYLLGLLLVFLIPFMIGARLLGEKLSAYMKGFGIVFLLAIVAYFLAANQTMKEIGFGYAAWAILLGLVISNTVGTPKVAKPGLKTEFYIKTGLVLLGAEILLGKIMAIGLPGIFVAWIVTPTILITTFWFGQKVLKITSKTLNITISADMSVCGVSAAVATAAACNAKKEELTLAIGLSMLFTSIMMILLPIFINWVGMPEVLGGAWIGGTIDATGAVVAAGAFLGDKALAVAATIKMIQNVLIGIIAFFVAIYFTIKVEKKQGHKVGGAEIWKRFPKFILGFIGASVIFTILYAILGQNLGYTYIDNGIIGGFSKNLRGWLFCLAFVSIGLATNFKELRSYFKGGKPLILYLSGQALNLILTLLMAYLMFYVVFPQITESL